MEYRILYYQKLIKAFEITRLKIAKAQKAIHTHVYSILEVELSMKELLRFRSVRDGGEAALCASCWSGDCEVVVNVRVGASADADDGSALGGTARLNVRARRRQEPGPRGLARRRRGIDGDRRMRSTGRLRGWRVRGCRSGRRERWALATLGYTLLPSFAAHDAVHVVRESHTTANSYICEMRHYTIDKTNTNTSYLLLSVLT